MCEQSLCIFQMKTKKRHRNSAPEWGAYCNLSELGQSEFLQLLLCFFLLCILLTDVAQIKEKDQQDTLYSAVLKSKP